MGGQSIVGPLSRDYGIYSPPPKKHYYIRQSEQGFFSLHVIFFPENQTVSSLFNQTSLSVEKCS